MFNSHTWQVAVIGQHRSRPSKCKEWCVDQQLQRAPGVCWKCKLLGPTLALPNENLHFNKFPRCSERILNFEVHCSGMQACPGLTSNLPCAKTHWGSRNHSSSEVTPRRGTPETPEVSFELTAHILETCQLQLRPLAGSPLQISKP